jgi:hypothetical protein
MVMFQHPGLAARSDATRPLAYTQAREHLSEKSTVISKGDFSQTEEERPRLLLKKATAGKSGAAFDESG